MTRWLSTHALDVALYLSIATALLRALSRALAPYPRARAAVEALGGSVTLPEAVPSEHEKKTARREVNKTAKAAK